MSLWLELFGNRIIVGHDSITHIAQAIVIWTAMLLESSIRLLGSQGWIKENAIGGAQIALWSSKSLFIILTWLKLMRQFTVLPAVGALHRTLFLIADYLAHFSLFLIVFCMGFGIALTYAGRNYSAKLLIV